MRKGIDKQYIYMCVYSTTTIVFKIREEWIATLQYYDTIYTYQQLSTTGNRDENPGTLGAVAVANCNCAN